MPAVKVGTCNYCGTRAALVLSGDKRHELACGTCGAPLHDLKIMPRPVQAAPKPEPKAAPSHSRAMSGKTRKKPKKSRKKKSFKRRMMGELWDIVEDIFD